jgi:disulfide bond formation protein DsbB
MAWGAFVLSLATILGAWGFELIGGYTPCHLCLGERIPYYVGVPIAALAVFAAMTGRVAVTRMLLLIVAGVFIWSVYLGVYHAGVEWRWWPGPPACSGDISQVTLGQGGNLLGQLEEGHRVVSCTDATWHFPGDWGLSFAGWNAVISAAVVAMALLGALLPTRRSAQGSSSVSQ